MVSEWKFHLTAGILCLDFANTLSWRRSPAPVERINQVRDLGSWARQVGLISKKKEAELGRWALENPRRSAAWLREARHLREMIFVVFAASAEGHAVPEDQLNELTTSIREAIRRSRLTLAGNRYRWSVADDRDAIRAILDAVAVSAESLLRSEDFARIGECSGRDCRWLWIDRTKNQSRRWCDMAVCGNRAKVHRHYLRSSAA